MTSCRGVITPSCEQGSVYRRVNAVEEIQQTRKDDFWGQAQVQVHCDPWDPDPPR